MVRSLRELANVSTCIVAVLRVRRAKFVTATEVRERDVIAIRMVGWLKFSRRRNKKEIWRDFVALSFGMS